MRFIVDFHIHSHYSRSTSKQLNPENLDYWSKLKGIQVMGTGDCIHPGWFSELAEKLEPSDRAGLYQLKREYKVPALAGTLFDTHPTYFMLTTEISTIYKKGDKVRKVHHVIVFPSFEAAKKLQDKLGAIGNITSDGRPILGLDSKILLEMALDTDPFTFLIPAHVWTPWFSVLGSKSGFDSIDECYEDLTQHIFAVETGLSSDPPMNRVCSVLDKFRLVSNSDAHSPGKLGREANLFDTSLTYEGIYNALKQDNGFLGTVEFFAQEGKYHYDGHRKCNVCWDPLETIKHHGICSVCGKPVVKGVMYRVAELADRPVGSIDYGKQIFRSITPLPELLAEIANTASTSSKKVEAEYFKMLHHMGSEFDILLNHDVADLKSAGFATVAEGISRLRDGRVYVEEGYDGEFGRVKVFQPDEIRAMGSAQLFQIGAAGIALPQKIESIEFDIPSFQDIHAKSIIRIENNKAEIVKPPMPLFEESTSENSKASDVCQELVFLSPQDQAITHEDGPCMVVAGPGAGKTYVLTQRIKRLIDNNISPDQILALTFTNQAANEMRERIGSRESENEQLPWVSTFHAFGLSIIKNEAETLGFAAEVQLIDEDMQLKIIETLFEINTKNARIFLHKFLMIKQGQEVDPSYDMSEFQGYQNYLRTQHLMDLADLVYLPVQLFQTFPHILTKYRDQFLHVLVDEFQDINAIQYQLIMQLAGFNEANLFVIGDPDQAIYGFRGSDVRFMAQLQSELPSIKMIGLEKSYRCPANVLQVAGQVLEKSKVLQGEGSAIEMQIQAANSAKAEADWIAAKIEQLMGGVRSFSVNSGISDGVSYDDITSFSDIAILCRSKIQFDAIVQSCQDHGIFYQLVSNTSFLQKPALKALISDMKAAFYPDLSLINDNETKSNTRAVLSAAFNNKPSIVDIIGLIQNAYACDAADLRQLVGIANSFGSDYPGFFERIMLKQGADDYDTKVEAVSIMSLHAAKGLEFNAVFIPGCEEGLLPFELFGKKTAEEVLEEARLFYVGITRTKRYLYLSYAAKRQIKGQTLSQRSRFLDKLDEGLISVTKREPQKKYANKVDQMGLFKS